MQSEDLARRIRIHALKMANSGGGSHIGSALSISDILAVLYSDILNIKKESIILTKYFENYRNYLKKNTLNSLLKGVIKPNF